MRFHRYFLQALAVFLLFTGLVDGHPFDYDLHLFRIPGETSATMICFHGMGGDYRIAQSIKRNAEIGSTLISFNFPDFGKTEDNLDEAEKTTFGTIHELLPAMYVLKKCIIDEKLDEIDLYGLSAGGGALINVLAVLNTTTYDSNLKEIDIHQEEKREILAAIQRGRIILDVPLKSIEEIIDFHGSQPHLEIVNERYKNNEMVPIAALKHLKNLALHFLVYFENPDEVLSNRDDLLFLDTLKKYNQNGTTIEIIGTSGRHGCHHPLLWKYFLR